MSLPLQRFRWPGVVPPDTVINDIFSHQDWLPTLLAAAGEPDINDKLKGGYVAGDKSFKVYIDGFRSDRRAAGAQKSPPQ